MMKKSKKLSFKKIEIAKLDNFSTIKGGASHGPGCDQIDPKNTIYESFKPGCANYTRYRTCYCFVI